MTVNRLKKRIEKLEQIITPPAPLQSVVIYMEGNETDKEAIARTGINSEEREDYNFWIIQIVEPPARDPISGNN